MGDWYYAPDFTYDAPSVLRFIVETVCRDGNAALNIPIKPDGSLEDACVLMLEEIGKWMDVCGEGIYGSSAWKVPAEGTLDENGNLVKLPGGGLWKRQAEFKFSPQDIRFTLGKNGDVYAFCMAAPQGGQTISIKSLGTAAKLLDEIKDVTLLGYGNKLEWHRSDEALEITCPEEMPFTSVVAFRISL